MSTYSREEARQIAAAIRAQITPGVLMSLGARKFGFSTEAGAGSDRPGLVFVARVLPFKKNGERSASARNMRVQVTLNLMDTYDVLVDYPQPGDKFGLKPYVVHESFSNVYADQLARVMLSIDSDHDRAAA